METLCSQVLGSLKEELQVTMVGVTRDHEECNAAAPTNSRHGVQFECLQFKHFEPEVSQSLGQDHLHCCVLTYRNLAMHDRSRAG